MCVCLQRRCARHNANYVPAWRRLCFSSMLKQTPTGVKVDTISNPSSLPNAVNSQIYGVTGAWSRHNVKGAQLVVDQVAGAQVMDQVAGAQVMDQVAGAQVMDQVARAQVLDQLT